MVLPQQKIRIEKWSLEGGRRLIKNNIVNLELAVLFI